MEGVCQRMQVTTRILSVEHRKGKKQENVTKQDNHKSQTTQLETNPICKWQSLKT